MALDNYRTKELSTKSLFLKRGKLQDYLSVYEYDFRELANKKLVKHKKSEIKDWFSKGVEYYHRKNEQRHVFDWIVYKKNGSDPVGNLIAYGENLKKLEIEISLNLHPKYWGNGYTEEIFEFMIDYLFYVGYESISVVFSSANTKTHDVLCKLGLNLDRVKKDAWFSGDKAIDDYIMKITKNKWTFRHFVKKK
jgi:RimJ/RimL family protein N-acetyltransferase